MHMNAKRSLCWGWELKNKTEKKSPTRTLEEFANEVGTSYREVRSAIVNDVNRGLPTPAYIQGLRNGNANVRYYRAHELRQWWANRQSQESQNVKAVD